MQSKYDYKGRPIELINYGMDEKIANDKTIYKYDNMGNMTESNKEINDIEYREIGIRRQGKLEKIYKGVKENIFNEYEIIKLNMNMMIIRIGLSRLVT